MRKSEPDKHELVSRLLIIDDANRCIYGRGLLESIALGRDKGKVHKVVGISAEALIVYLAHDWPDIPECREALRLLSRGRRFPERLQLRFELTCLEEFLKDGQPGKRGQLLVFKL